MRLSIKVIDAFECGPLTGNPAAVCVLDDWIPPEMMQSIASRLNLSETAFLVRSIRSAAELPVYDLRWFTPTVEIELCGHATLASAHVLRSHGRVAGELEGSDRPTIAFDTASGRLMTEFNPDQTIRLALPAAVPKPIVPIESLDEAIGCELAVVSGHRMDVVIELDSENAVRRVAPDWSRLAEVDVRMVCVTARCEPDAVHDFVVRVFAPRLGINEDPATGSAQCLLGPYWSTRIGERPLRCYQASARGAELISEWAVDEQIVWVAGSCRTASHDEIEA